MVLRIRLPPMLPQVFLSDAWYWVFRSMGMGLMKLRNYWIIVILSLWILYRVVGIVQLPSSYMINSQGHVVVNYENAQSIAFKCRFTNVRGMLGAMYGTMIAMMKRVHYAMLSIKIVMNP